MTRFEAEIRLQDLSEVDALTARRAVEEKLRDAGFKRWKIVRIGPQRPNQKSFQRPLARPLPNGVSPRRADAGQGMWVVVAALAWAVWFVWLLGG